jgi:allophanate hydrolase
MAEGPLTLREYRDAYGSGAWTPVGAVAEVYRRIAAHDDPAMFITLRPLPEVEAEARALEVRGPAELALYGVPVAVKDNIDVAGLPTTAACPDFSYAPQRDATAVARLRAAGALVVGKTNLDQFATGLVGVRSPYGVPRNTARADLVPGGSSSGSAAAVAAGIVPIALGTDTAGSGRVPAGLNNIVGLKPSLGLVPTRGVVPACRTLDCVSVFALTVDDARAALAVMAGFDADDPFSRPVGLANESAPPRLRLGVPDGASRRFGGDPLSEAAFDAALADAAALGAELRPVDLEPFFAAAALLYDEPWVAERYAAIRDLFEGSPGSLHPVTRAVIGRAASFSAADAFSAQYRLAEIRRVTEPLWRDIDLLAVPTYPRPVTLAELQADPVGPNAELGTYTNFVNLLDLCALAVPTRRRTDGLPSGVTLIAPSGHDSRLAAFGVRLHAAGAVSLGATGRPVPSPESADAPDLADGEIEIAVVGAHLSGLPLNRDLTSRAARFRRAVRTRPDYRLFALAGGPPRRPGLLRVEAGGGRAIETEVWALDAAGLGSFMATVPSPLAIGTVRLADGTEPKGFVVEHEATRSAEDISEHGGWRAYLATL